MKLKIFMLEDCWQLKVFKNNQWYLLAESNTLSGLWSTVKRVQRHCHIPFISLVRS